MKYSINLDYFTTQLKWDIEHIAPVISKAGFTALDYTPDLSSVNWKEQAYLDLEVCKKNGLKIHQTHAPYNRYGQWGKDEYLVALERAYEITKIFGAKYMVVHGDEYDFENNAFSEEKAIAYNYELFAPYVEKGIKDNIDIAFETVFQDLTPDKVRYCSKFDELKGLIEKYNSENVCCCWDLGHAQLAFGDEHADKIRAMGKHIKCTHIHDNYYGKDLHLPLFMGNIDLKACKMAFDDIAYEGDYSLEIVYGNIPKSLTDNFIKYLYESLVLFTTI